MDLLFGDRLSYYTYYHEEFEFPVGNLCSSNLSARSLWLHIFTYLAYQVSPPFPDTTPTASPNQNDS